MTEFIIFCSMLSPEYWQRKAITLWTVRDLIVHMVGWEEKSYKALIEVKKTMKSITQPSKEECDELNRLFSVRYASYSNDALITEWKYWRKKIDKFISENDMKSEIFCWFFDDHKDHHFLQVKKLLENSPN